MSVHVEEVDLEFGEYTYVPVDLSCITRNDLIARHRGLGALVYRAKSAAKWHRGDDFKISCERMADGKSEHLYFATGQAVAKLIKIDEAERRLAAAESTAFALGTAEHVLAPPLHLLIDEEGDIAVRTKSGAMSWIRVRGQWSRVSTVYIYQWLCPSNPLERVWRIVSNLQENHHADR